MKFKRLWIRQFFRFLSSLKLAVSGIIGLASCLAVGTVLESIYDTATARYWIYRAWYFYGLLALFGVNILCVALSRYPWKKKHLPFLMAHAGILILLGGAFLTDRWGVDAQLRLTEGETSHVVQLDDTVLVLSRADGSARPESHPIKWVPPHVRWRPQVIRSALLAEPLEIVQFYSHADAEIRFDPDKSSSAKSAIQIRISGGPMQIRQDYWLWLGEEGWRQIQAGPARFALLPTESAGRVLAREWSRSEKPWAVAWPLQSGRIGYLSRDARGVAQAGKPWLKWKSVQVELLQALDRASPHVDYRPSSVQYGPQAPPPALLVRSRGGAQVWLGQGDRTSFDPGTPGAGVMFLGYLQRRIELPFDVRLDRFSIDTYEGTEDPSSYSSRVTVYSGGSQQDRFIRMNEPLEKEGFTLYQASYEPGEGEGARPRTSIFTVNRDPGRFWKYAGSLLIVLGSVLLFISRLRARKSVVMS